MPSGGLVVFGSGLRLQPLSPGVVDVGNANINGTMIAGSFDTRNAPTAAEENFFAGSQKTYGTDLTQGTTAVGFFQKIGPGGVGFTPQFATLLGNSANVFCNQGTALGNGARAGVSRGNVNQANPHTAVGYSSSATLDSGDFTSTIANTATGAKANAVGKRCYAFGYAVQMALVGNQDNIWIGSNIQNSVAITNNLTIRSAAATKTLTATDSNSIIIGEPTQTRVLIGPYTITAGVSAVAWLQTATATVANTIAQTTLTASGVGTLTVPAGRFAVGTTLRIKAFGTIADTLTPTINLRVIINGVTVIDFGAVTLPALGGTKGWSLDAEIVCRTTGAPGTCFGQGTLSLSDGASLTTAKTANVATSALQTTAAQLVDVTAQWGTADPANTISCTNLTMELVG